MIEVLYKKDTKFDRKIMNNYRKEMGKCTSLINYIHMSIYIIFT